MKLRSWAGMSNRQFLTPDTQPNPPVRFDLWLPGGDDWEALARGALTLLLDADNFEDTNTNVTPDDAARAFLEALTITFTQW